MISDVRFRGSAGIPPGIREVGLTLTHDAVVADANLRVGASILADGRRWLLVHLSDKPDAQNQRHLVLRLETRNRKQRRAANRARP